MPGDGTLSVLIIGSGPAGYTAAIYAARAGLSPVMLTGETPGGQLTTTSDVENFPGYPAGVQGTQMMVDMQQQAERFGTQILYDTVKGVDFSVEPFVVFTTEGKALRAHAVIIATGASARYLGLPSERQFANKGVSACAICDGYFYRGKDVAVVGSGDSAAEEATYLSQLCNEVHLLVRSDRMRASQIMQQRVLSLPNIKIHWNTEAQEILGDDAGVNGVSLFNNKTNEVSRLSIQGFFLAIGHKPNTGPFVGHIDLDDEGYVSVKPGTTHTSVQGVFAVGDVADRVYRQAITAAGMGCMGALDAERFLSRRHKVGSGAVAHSLLK